MIAAAPSLTAGIGRSTFWWIVGLTLCPAVLGVAFARYLLASGIVNPETPNVEVIVTLMLFVAQDLPRATAFGVLVPGALLIAPRLRFGARRAMDRAAARGPSSGTHRCRGQLADRAVGLSGIRDVAR